MDDGSAHLYLQHRQRALAVVGRILHDPAEAEDVVQEVFFRLVATRAQFRGEAAYTTWLHRILVNRSVSTLRSRRRRARLSHCPQEPASPEEEAIGAELRSLFRVAIDQLSPQHRRLLVLRELHGLDYAQIADQLEIPEGTVKSALNRARARLAEVLQEER